jgi:hypothetical protein
MKRLLVGGFYLVLISAMCMACQSEGGQKKKVEPVVEKPVAKTSSAAVAKIVFIDKEKACDCTAKRINDSWTALQEALGKESALPIERIHMDTQAAQAESYKTQRAYMVAPAIYFLDANGQILEMLQGEVSSEQFKKTLR